ncbi:hypothetical protein [Streptomyces sp. NPDC058247]|uniref:hypothetical protein n=1 Tax=Streptomyces sp. NPDC058247 TaxID=3346401 RepID=UPI0036E53977
MATTGNGLTFTGGLRHLIRRPHLLIPLALAAPVVIWTREHWHLVIALPLGILLAAIGSVPMMGSLERLKVASTEEGGTAKDPGADS